MGCHYFYASSRIIFLEFCYYYTLHGIVVIFKPPAIDCHKSFDEDEFSKKPDIVKKTVTAPVNVTSYSIADLQIVTGSFSMDHLLGEGSFGRVYRAQFDDGEVFLT